MRLLPVPRGLTGLPGKRPRRDAGGVVVGAVEDRQGRGGVAVGSELLQLRRAVTDTQEGLARRDEAVLQKSCQDMHDAGTVDLRAHLPTPDPDLTAELDAAINDAHEAAHLEQLKRSGRHIITIDKDGVTFDDAIYATLEALQSGPDIVFQPTNGDMKKLVDALVILGDIFLAAGALEVYASTRTYKTYKSGTAVISAQSELDRLRQLVTHDYDILLGTGHPQGGNAIGVSPQNSVVGPDFKVFGYDNLYVCDASVFPTSSSS